MENKSTWKSTTLTDMINELMKYVNEHPEIQV